MKELNERQRADHIENKCKLIQVGTRSILTFQVCKKKEILLIQNYKNSIELSSFVI